MTDVTGKRLRLLYKLLTRLGRDRSDPQLCRLSYEQLEYVNHRLALQCYLGACPGSGKTEVVGLKAAYEMARWRSKGTGIAILTFTKTAAAEIGKRVREYGGASATGHPHFVGTIDSWLHNYLLQPFGHAVAKYTGDKSGPKTKSPQEVIMIIGFNENQAATSISDSLTSLARAQSISWSSQRRL